jgi:hypothetical protein
MYSRAADSRQIPVSLFAEPVVWWLVRELRWQSANGWIVYFLSLCSSVRFASLWSFLSQKPGLCAIYLVRFPELRWWRRETCDWETDCWPCGLRWFSFQPDRTGLWVKSLQSKRLPFIFLWSLARGVFCSCNPFVCTCGLFYQEIADVLCR